MGLLTSNGTVAFQGGGRGLSRVKVIVGANGYTTFGGGSVALVEIYTDGYEKTIKTYTAVETIPETIELPEGKAELRLTGATSPSLYLALQDAEL